MQPLPPLNPVSLHPSPSPSLLSWGRSANFQLLLSSLLGDREAQYKDGPREALSRYRVNVWYINRQILLTTRELLGRMIHRCAEDKVLVAFADWFHILVLAGHLDDGRLAWAREGQDRDPLPNNIRIVDLEPFRRLNFQLRKTSSWLCDGIPQAHSSWLSLLPGVAAVHFWSGTYGPGTHYNRLSSTRSSGMQHGWTIENLPCGDGAIAESVIDDQSIFALRSRKEPEADQSWSNIRFVTLTHSTARAGCMNS